MDQSKVGSGVLTYDIHM